MRQVELESLVTGKKQVCWLDGVDKIRKGAIISLKGSEERHKVLRTYKLKVERERLYRPWKVGGLT